MRNPWFWIFVALVLMSLLGEIPWSRFSSSEPTLTPTPAKPSRPTLFILIHGFEPNEDRLAGTVQALQGLGDVLRVDYPARWPSDTDASTLSQHLDAKLEEALGGCDGSRYADVRIVAHSSGALVARRTLLDGWANHHRWADRISRVVLLAGMNRGWSTDGVRPLDMPWWKRWAWRIGEWAGRLTGTGHFIIGMKAGSPFVANLRIDWMAEMARRGSANALEVVQLLGDIDDIVSSDDNEDVRVMPSRKYAMLRERGTGHKDIIDFADPELGAYRRAKLVLAASADFTQVLAQNEAQPQVRDDDVKIIVFVLHGIRDLGRWSSEFETSIRAAAAQRAHLAPRQVVIVSPRYGYLGMGPFLLPAVRERYVRWFMDEYTETLARYPHVPPEGIEFFGHSNGTEVLAGALHDYTSLRVGKVVFAGSVVPKDYDWGRLIGDGRATRVRNYVGTSDWVVALFPRLFEILPARWLRNDIGSAGFNGFDQGNHCADAPAVDTRRVTQVENVCYVKGAHAAFDEDRRVGEIVDFLIADTTPPARTEPRSAWATVFEFRATVWLVWLAIVSAVIYVGVRVVSSAPAPTSIALVAFVLVVVRLLQTV